MLIPEASRQPPRSRTTAASAPSGLALRGRVSPGGMLLLTCWCCRRQRPCLDQEGVVAHLVAEPTASPGDKGGRFAQTRPVFFSLDARQARTAMASSCSRQAMTASIFTSSATDRSESRPRWRGLASEPPCSLALSRHWLRSGVVQPELRVLPWDGSGAL